MPGTMFGLRSTFGSSGSGAAESSGSGAAESSGSGAAESSGSGAAESSGSGAASSPRASPISLAASAASASSEIAPSSRALAAEPSAGSNRSSRVSSSKEASPPSDAATSAASRSARSLNSSAMARSRRASSSSAFPSPVCFDVARLFVFRAAEDRALRSRSSSGRGFANARVASKSSASLSRSASRRLFFLRASFSSPRRLFLPKELSARVFSIPQSSLRPPARVFFRETSSRRVSAAARPRSATAGFARDTSRSNDGSEKIAASASVGPGSRLDPRRARMRDSAVGVGAPATSAPPAMTSAPNATPATTPRVTDQGVCSRARDGAGAACEEGEGKTGRGEHKKARPRGEASRPGRGRGRSGAVGGGRTRLKIPHGDPARPSRPPREARWTRGGPAAMPREPRKCLLRASATGPIARVGSGGHASRRTISGSARSMCREVPLWYPRALDGAAAVCSMARARLPSPASGRDVILGVTKTCYRESEAAAGKNVLAGISRTGRPFLFAFVGARKTKAPREIREHFGCVSQSENSSPFSRIVVTAFSVRNKISERNRARTRKISQTRA